MALSNYLRIPGIFLCLLAMASPVAATSLHLTVDEAILRGLEQNPQVKGSHLAVAEAEEGINQSRSAFLPTLSVDYSYRRLYNNTNGERDTDFLSQRSQTFQSRLTQPLFKGFSSVAGYRKAELTRDYRHYQLNDLQRRLVLEVKQNFADYLWAQQRLVRWEESVGRLKRQIELVSAWVAEDFAPRLRLLELETELAHALQQQVGAQADLATAAADLRAWLMIPADIELFLIGELTSGVDPIPGKLIDYIEQALQYRPELKLTATDISLAQQERRIIRARKLPEVNLEGSWVDFERDYRTGGVPSDDRNYYTVGVNITLRPFQGGAVYYADRRQDLQIRRLGEVQRYYHSAIVAEVTALYERLQEGRSRLDAAAQGIAAAQEAYAFAEEASRLGAASLDTLLNAELRLTRAELDLLDARYQQQLALIRFEHALGLVTY
ncbi:TolC family protein [Pelovirga terrestris]|uniref:TolC family protein n=1 Tax=Pelovirga terrestris TaxID=2771352 RepID=A0A8J6QV69_9BACT|nr:TolC family protein [Pelovirga terrestris]MBD1401315.1 TolC family protein [Pelovirga terrestris]